MQKARWGGTIGVLLLVLINAGFPQRYVWGSGEVREAFTIGLSAMFVLSVVGTAVKISWDARNVSVLVVVGLACAFNALTLYQLVAFMIWPHPDLPTLDGVRLLSSAVAIWLTNVVSFALLYWVVDGGGPDDRLRDPQGPRDLAFPGDSHDPNFADYVFLAFNTATAFSPTDTAPLTTRVRMMMLAESAISLLALAIAAARAVNILH
ncbi:MAG TPA: DUF1345 domain-containing protein [Candidatus Baltobacteraceae bacterium]|jgi:hypothetical protein|nr:DUF1345 domain-containing protein [Candidatus Baltobacteraceae bacterium]